MSPPLLPKKSWMIFNSLFGWQNSATYGSVISYNLYWLVVILGFAYMGWKENKEAVTPVAEPELESDTSSGHQDFEGKRSGKEGVLVGTATKQLQ